MTAKQLIRILQAFPPDTEVILEVEDADGILATTEVEKARRKYHAKDAGYPTEVEDAAGLRAWMARMVKQYPDVVRRLGTHPERHGWRPCLVLTGRKGS